VTISNPYYIEATQWTSNNNPDWIIEALYYKTAKVHTNNGMTYLAIQDIITGMKYNVPQGHYIIRTNDHRGDIIVWVMTQYQLDQEYEVVINHET